MSNLQFLQQRDDGSTYILYNYVPGLAAAIIAIIVFAILSSAHGFRLIKNRMWFCTPFLVGGLFETIGYVGRAISHGNKQSLSPYIMQTLLILVAPALFAATLYMTLSRIITATHSEHYSLIRKTWLTRVFVTADIVTFFIQGGGGGIQASGDGDKVKLGENIILAGLATQLAIFTLFIVVAVLLHVRLARNPTMQSASADVRWQRMLFVLYICSGLIMVRNIMRIAEYVGGRQGYLLSHEWTIYVFDMMLMAGTMIVYFIGYPTMLAQKADSFELEEQKLSDGGAVRTRR